MPLKMSEAPVLCIKKGQLVGNLKLTCHVWQIWYIIGCFPCWTWGGFHQKFIEIRLLEICGFGDEQLFWRESTTKMDIPYILEGPYFQRTKNYPNNPIVSSPTKSSGARTTVTGPKTPCQLVAPLRRSTRRTRRTRRGGVWDRCVWCVWGSGLYGFLLVRSAGKSPPNRKASRKVENLWTQKVLRKKNHQNGDITKLNYEYCRCCHFTLSHTTGVRLRSCILLARDTSTAGLMLWLVLSL